MSLLSLETYARSEGYSKICGTDEAGRGPLAGPVFAAAVIFPEGYRNDDIKDSKKLSEKKRERLFDVITSAAESFSISSASVEEIEVLNILQAALLAMRRAVVGLSVAPDLVLVDGNQDPMLDFPSRMIVKGDTLSMSIAAASILAKVSRDRVMRELDKQYPEYKFAQHKGYGTKLHYEALRKYGVLPIHRKAFLRKFLASNDK